MHAVCSMVEDIAKLATKSELTLESKVPLIDHFYQSMSELNQRVDETGRTVKDVKEQVPELINRLEE